MTADREALFDQLARVFARAAVDAYLEGQAEFAVGDGPARPTPDQRGNSRREPNGGNSSAETAASAIRRP